MPMWKLAARKKRVVTLAPPVTHRPENFVRVPVVGAATRMKNTERSPAVVNSNPCAEVSMRMIGQLSELVQAASVDAAVHLAKLESEPQTSTLAGIGCAVPVATSPLVLMRMV